MMGTYYAMDRMSKMKGEKNGKWKQLHFEHKQHSQTNGIRKYVREDLISLSTSGGRGGLIVNTASAAGLVFNQVAKYKYKFQFLYLIRKIDNQSLSPTLPSSH